MVVAGGLRQQHPGHRGGGYVSGVFGGMRGGKGCHFHDCIVAYSVCYTRIKAPHGMLRQRLPLGGVLGRHEDGACPLSVKKRVGGDITACISCMAC